MEFLNQNQQLQNLVHRFISLYPADRNVMLQWNTDETSRKQFVIYILANFLNDTNQQGAFNIPEFNNFIVEWSKANPLIMTSIVNTYFTEPFESAKLNLTNLLLNYGVIVVMPNPYISGENMYGIAYEYASINMPHQAVYSYSAFTSANGVYLKQGEQPVSAPVLTQNTDLSNNNNIDLKSQPEAINGTMDLQSYLDLIRRMCVTIKVSAQLSFLQYNEIKADDLAIYNAFQKQHSTLFKLDTNSINWKGESTSYMQLQSHSPEFLDLLKWNVEISNPESLPSVQSDNLGLVIPNSRVSYGNNDYFVNYGTTDLLKTIGQTIQVSILNQNGSTEIIQVKIVSDGDNLLATTGLIRRLKGVRSLSFNPVKADEVKKQDLGNLF